MNTKLIAGEQLEKKDEAYRHRALTLGTIGGVNVPFFKPSQLKPSNHLQEKPNVLFYYFTINQ